MAKNGRTAEDVRKDIAREREELAGAVEELRGDLAQATDIGGKLRAKLPVAAAGAAGIGFVLAGGIGATMRYLARRGREDKERVRVGRFSLRDRR
jgi:hypothetical protein